MSSGFSFSVNRGRSRAAGRSPAALRDRARRWPVACRPVSILRGCPASCRAKRGIRPAKRSAPLPRLPNAWAVVGGAAPVSWVAGRVACPRAGRRPDPWAGGAWRGVVPAVRQRSAVRRGDDVWECRSPIVNRDCHVSRMARAVDPVCCGVFGFAASSLFGAGKAVLRPVACGQVPGARARGQGTETLAQLWRRAASAELVFRSALTPEHAEGRWTGRRAFRETAATSAAVVGFRMMSRGERAIGAVDRATSLYSVDRDGSGP